MASICKFCAGDTYIRIILNIMYLWNMYRDTVLLALLNVYDGHCWWMYTNFGCVPVCSSPNSGLHAVYNTAAVYFKCIALHFLIWVACYECSLVPILCVCSKGNGKQGMVESTIPFLVYTGQGNFEFRRFSSAFIESLNSFIVSLAGVN